MRVMEEMMDKDYADHQCKIEAHRMVQVGEWPPLDEVRMAQLVEQRFRWQRTFKVVRFDEMKKERGICDA
jgi:hypothetical protein